MVIAKNGELRSKTGRTATFVVAASDSEHKDEADYICDGTDDQVEIQAALDALPASGGTVVLTDGLFVISGQISVPSYSILSGSGTATIINRSSYAGIPVTGANNAVGLTISNMVLDGNQASNSSTNALLDFNHQRNSHIEKIKFQNVTDSGYVVALYKSEECIIEKCHITSGHYGINLTGDESTREGKRNIVKNNIITGFSNTGVRLRFSDHTIVDGNIIYDNSSGNVLGINCYGNNNISDHCLVSNNIIYNLSGSGTGISNGPAKHSLICGNKIFNGYVGISGTGDYASIINNKVIDCRYRGIYYVSGSGCGIANNSVIGSGWKGNIIVADLSYSNVSNNICMNSIDGPGIAISGLNTALVVECNTLSDDQTPKTQTYGFKIADNTTNVLIQNNRIKNNLTAGFLIGNNTSGIIFYQQYVDLFMDVLATLANAVHAAIVGTGAEQEITTAITNPDVPRNVSITNSANSTGDVVITGVDAKGNSVTDTITIVTGGIAYGVVAFASVSKITIPATVANPDTMTVGISDKLGLSNIIYASGDVYKVKVNNADDPTIGTVNVTYHTVDCATINAADDITIWYRSNLNIIS